MKNAAVHDSGLAGEMFCERLQQKHDCEAENTSSAKHDPKSWQCRAKQARGELYDLVAPSRRQG
jgi:hypothetical protein